MKLIIFLFVSFFIGASMGFCHKIPHLESYQKERTMGTWFVIQYGPVKNNTAYSDPECMEETYSQNKDNPFVIDYSIKYWSAVNKTIVTKNAFGTQPDAKRPYQLHFYVWNMAIQAQVVSTDYNNYFVAATFDENHEPVYWILSRRKSLDPKVTDTIKSFLGIPFESYKIYNWSNCPKGISMNAMSGASLDPDARCPPQAETSDCGYEDCHESGCPDGKVCCHKPCGGSWCIDPEE